MATINTGNTGNTVDQTLLTAMNGSNGKTKNTTQDAQDRFMTLLVTQMKNQDPLNPMDNAQVTSQMAQLSTVTGIEKLNASMATMNSNYVASQSLQAANMIGHGVITPGSNIALQDGKSVYALDLPQAADKASLVIRDQSGAVVRKIELGALPAGLNNMTWDGKNDAGTTLPNGNYQYEIEASAGNKKLDVTSLCFGVVNSVTAGAQGVKLTVSGVGQVGMNDVRQIY
ncbi:flagellar hook assembly protein FlgD [Undibacterium curvum]|uniref:Basal-body rod modification protein FlgD n=1 Tax=Undibacterium curvum TaxID=2762294 RepID=A0ABR7A7I5_9BURK|nr:flagellar hook assembly protein FlgD [Undibacterium curvum]MBC3932854.1 flagellar hook assembly protein FlgD [Undibacterium curvum]